MEFWKNLGLFTMLTAETPEERYCGYEVIKNELEKEEMEENEVNTITCIKCGFEFSKDYDHCPNCGFISYDE